MDWREHVCWDRDQESPSHWLCVITITSLELALAWARSKQGTTQLQSLIMLLIDGCYVDTPEKMLRYLSANIESGSLNLTHTTSSAYHGSTLWISV